MDFLGNKTVPDLWEEQTERSGDEWYLIYEDADGAQNAFTYAEMKDRIDRTAAALHDKLGIEKGDHVAIHLDNSPEYLDTWFGLLRLGAVAVHSNTMHTAHEIEYTLDTGDVESVVTSPRHLEVITEASEETDVNTIIVAREGLAADSDGGGDHVLLAELTEETTADPPDVAIDGDNPAQILFTSGTTADPKGVVHTHTNALYSGERVSRRAAMTGSDRMCMALPVFHVNGQIIGVLSTLTTGATLVLLEEYKTECFIDQLRRHRATLSSIVNTQLRAMLSKPESPTDDDNDLRDIFYSINVTKEEKREFEERFGAELLNGYGLSEACGIVSRAPVHGDRQWPAVGRPPLDRDVYVIDDDGNQLGPGEIGEIVIDGVRGRNLMKEYYKMPEKTAEAFTDEGWLRSGDYGHFDEDGNLYFDDRKKNIIESRGENVSEREVETALESHEKVEEAAIIGIPHEFYGSVPKAFIVSNTDDLTIDELENHAEERLAEFKQPAEYEIIDEFPRTSIGKIEKSALRDREQSRVETETEVE